MIFGVPKTIGRPFVSFLLLMLVCLTDIRRFKTRGRFIVSLLCQIFEGLADFEHQLQWLGPFSTWSHAYERMENFAYHERKGLVHSIAASSDTCESVWYLAHQEKKGYVHFISISSQTWGSNGYFANHGRKGYVHVISTSSETCEKNCFCVPMMRGSFVVILLHLIFLFRRTHCDWFRNTNVCA